MARDARATKAREAVEDPRYRSLLEVVDLISLHTDLEGLLTDVARYLSGLSKFDGLGFLLPLYLTDTEMFLVHTNGVGLEVKRVGFHPLHETNLAALWGTSTPVVIHDTETDRHYPEFSSNIAAAGFRSGCLLPLTTAVRPVGILAVVSRETGAYDAADLAFLQRVASQVAVAIDNVRHHEQALAYQRQLEAERDHWRTLLEVNNAVVANLDLKALLAAITPNIRRIVPHDSINLALLDANSGRVSLYAMDPPLPPEIADVVMSVDPENTPFARAITLRKPSLVAPEDLVDIPAPLVKYGRVKEFKSICLVPLFTPRRVLGAFSLASFLPDAFSAADLERLAHAGAQMAIAIENALAFREIAQLRDRLTAENLYLSDEVQNREGCREVLGDSRAMRRVWAQVNSVAATDAAVLLLGETGTGKELLARAIHRLSARHTRPLVIVNCATSPAGLLESEWFGHERGAFTGAVAQKVGRFELANEGTLFLDEIGDVPLDLQAKLLRALQEHEIERIGSARTLHVDFRLVAATNRNLEEMVANREYRSDLYYRLNVFPIRVPPLRERTEDIPALVHHFTQRYARKLRRHIDSIPRETMDALCRWPWPGNVRELQNVIERAVILSPGPRLCIPASEFEATPAGRPTGTLQDAEREHILRVLNETGWVIGGPRGAALRLGVKRTTLVSTMRRLGINRPRLTGQ